MVLIYRGYVTDVNLITRETGGAACHVGHDVLAENDAGDFDDRSDHSRSGHRTD